MVRIPDNGGFWRALRSHQQRPRGKAGKQRTVPKEGTVSSAKKHLSRRDFFKMTGLAGAGAASLPLAGKGLADTGKAASDPFARPWWVKSVEAPTVGATNGDFNRFSGASIFALFKGLKDQQDGEGSYDALMAEKSQKIAQWAQEGKPGYAVRDRALYDGAWTVMRSAQPGSGILSWDLIGNVTPPQDMGVDPYSASPEEMANTVKTVARFFGAALVGIAPMNENYVYLKQGGKDVVFKEVDVPEVTDGEMVIPKAMKWVVSVAVQMDHDLLARAPTALGEAGASMGYSTCAFLVGSLAEYIRGLGYQAIPMVNDTAASIPFAVDAGLGEMGRTNRLITPEFGPMVRVAKVFTDMPLPYDKPIDAGIADFCRTCMKCAEACPSGALSFEKDPSFVTQGAWNNPGHETWYEDSYKCYQYWQEITTGCGICLNACPFNKGDTAWVHDLVRATAATVPAADPTLRQMDDLFGYGAQQDPEAWWNQGGGHSFGVDSTRGKRS
jgi:epoxyqueuosine reductase